jgi:hypothetical protein
MTTGTKTAQVLSFIAKSVKNGRTFGEIQRHICEINGLDYDEMSVTRYGMDEKSSPRRRYRGYWNTALCGTNGYYCKRRIGILEKYCEKIGKKYIIKSAYFF